MMLPRLSKFPPMRQLSKRCTASFQRVPVLIMLFVSRDC